MIKIDGKLRLKENFLNFREDIYKKLQLTLYLMARKSKLLHQGKDVPYATLFQHVTDVIILALSNHIPGNLSYRQICAHLQGYLLQH